LGIFLNSRRVSIPFQTSEYHKTESNLLNSSNVTRNVLDVDGILHREPMALALDSRPVDEHTGIRSQT
jgi:hypothetical protein